MNFNEKINLILRHATVQEEIKLLGRIDRLYRKYMTQDSQRKGKSSKCHRKRQGRRILKLVSINGKSPPNN
ncbi:MAG: hypothetical protein IH886_05285 [Nitrospinae bacterium]|nr:hypothetical protein [Nitrospinota bacterium]